MTNSDAVRRPLPGERVRRGWSSGSLFVDLLQSSDLGNSSFVIGDRDQKSAIVIDATRDVARYLDALERTGLKLGWALDTHLHADFVSGGKELADLAGGRFGLSDQVKASFPHEQLKDQQNLPFGKWSLKVLRSPGHTPEHVSFLLQDAKIRPRVLFSGGSLMAGTAARPDLLGPTFTNSLVREEFTTLHERYRALPGALAVLPTHGGGSFCGVGARSSYSTTLGKERATNPLLRARDLSTFFGAYLSSTPYPAYYGLLREVNESGGRPVGRLIPDLPPLSVDDVEQLRSRPGVTVLDVRPPVAFARAHIPGSVSISRGGPLAAWVGWLRPPSETFVLVDDDPAVRRAVQIELVRIGYDGLRGYLDGGLPAYVAAGLPTASTQRVSMTGVRRQMASGAALTLLDVRNPDEVTHGRVPGSFNIPLPRLERDAAVVLDRTLPLYVHCQSGYRASIASSLLERMGFHDVRYVVDGPERWARRSSPHHRGTGS